MKLSERRVQHCTLVKNKSYPAEFKMLRFAVKRVADN
jgi:hypothetical protein